MPFPIFFGSRIIGQAADVLSDVDLHLHLPLDSRRFSVFPRRAHLRPKPLTHPPLSGGFHDSCQAFVPALAFLRLFRPRSRFVDEITALIERFLSGQAGKVTLSFRSGSLVFDRSR